MIHIHSRGADGLPTSDYGRTKEILDAVHKSCPILTHSPQAASPPTRSAPAWWS